MNIYKGCKQCYTYDIAQVEHLAEEEPEPLGWIIRMFLFPDTSYILMHLSSFFWLVVFKISPNLLI